MADSRVHVSEIDQDSRRLSLRNCSVQVMRQDPGTQIGPRLQHRIQLILIHAGQMSVSIEGGREFEVSAGQICLLLPETVETVSFRGDDPTVQTVVHGDPEHFTTQMHEWLKLLRPTRPLSAALTYLSREAVAAVQTRLTAQGALLDALSTALLWRFIAEFQNFPAALPSCVEDARMFIHKHVTDDIGLEDIASAAHVSQAHLIRQFRNYMATTPSKYLWDRRVTLGMELLTSSGMPVTVIAERSGFKTSFHFARKVKEASGLSPTQLRESSWRLSRDERSSRGEDGA